MTSVVDKYYRRIIQNIDHIKMKFDISALLVKSKEHDSLIDTNKNNISDNLGKIETNESNFSDNLDKIDTNKNNISDNTSLIDTNKNNISDNTSLIDTNKNNISSNTSLIDTNKNSISSNLTKIDTNVSDISSNLTKIDTNKNSISSNLTKIDTNVSDISSNLTKINTNKTNISDNLELINTNKTNISDNLELINTNKTNISSNLTKIDTNESKISSNLTKINTNENSITNLNNDLTNLKDGYKLKDIIVFNITNNVSQDVSQNRPSFIILNDSINSFIKKDSYIQINTSISLYFILHYINIGYYEVVLKILNDKNNLISLKKMPLIGMISKHSISLNTCYVKILNDYNSINLELSIQIKENQKRSDIVKILDTDNYVYCKIYEKLDNSIIYVDDDEFDV